MAHYAELDENNVVVNVFVGRDEDDLADGITDWEIYYARPGFTVKRTSYNTRNNEHLNGGVAYRGNYAGIGYTYDETLDAFIPPRPYPSWTLNTNVFNWEAPVAIPTEGGPYEWNEAALNWVEVSE